MRSRRRRMPSGGRRQLRPPTLRQRWARCADASRPSTTRPRSSSERCSSSAATSSSAPTRAPRGRSSRRSSPSTGARSRRSTASTTATCSARMTPDALGGGRHGVSSRCTHSEVCRSARRLKRPRVASARLRAVTVGSATLGFGGSPESAEVSGVCGDTAGARAADSGTPGPPPGNARRGATSAPCGRLGASPGTRGVAALAMG